MQFLNKLGRKLSRFAIPNLTVLLIVPQILMFVISQVEPERMAGLYLVPAWVLQGEVWRLVSFLFVPPGGPLIFALLYWYFFYWLGTSMEQYWGTAKYNGYLLVAYLATVGVAFLVPQSVATNVFISNSVFLAFAYLNPEFVIYLFFVLPVKLKWLAWLAWAGYLITIIFGSWPDRLMATAGVINFFLFFGLDVYSRARYGHRHMTRQARAFSRPAPTGPRHRCVVCGATEQSHRHLDFRYCSKCEGTCCYCEEHLPNHEHVVKEGAAEA